MIDIEALTAEAKANEPKTIYDSYKAQNLTATEWTCTPSGSSTICSVTASSTISSTSTPLHVQTDVYYMDWFFCKWNFDFFCSFDSCSINIF